MTKRLIILAGALCLALLTNLSFRVPTAVQAQAQAACVTATAPAFTFGVDKNLQLPGGGILKDGDLFYLGNNNGIQFTTISPDTFLQTFANEASAVPVGYPNTINLRFQSQTPNQVATAVSCLDSFWDINFALYGGGGNAAGVAGDVYELYLQQPNGSGRISLATFTATADGKGATVTSIIPGGDLSAIGHTPTIVGKVIPFEIAGGTDPNSGLPQQRTSLITLALPMDGSVPKCAQLGLTIRKAGGNGRSMIVLANLVVTRSDATTATGTGIQSNIAGLKYPTARVCDNVCPACPPAITCDTVLCFADASAWCNRLSFRNRYLEHQVVVPGVNFDQPIPVFTCANGIRNFTNCTVNPLVSQYLGCGGFMRMDMRSQLIAAYLAAQLDIQTQLPFWWVKLNKQALLCHVITPMSMPGMPGAPRALPATISGGPITSLTDASSLQDLFTATNWVVTKGSMDDLQKLIAIYKQLNTCRKD